MASGVDCATLGPSMCEAATDPTTGRHPCRLRVGCAEACGGCRQCAAHMAAVNGQRSTGQPTPVNGTHTHAALELCLRRPDVFDTAMVRVTVTMGRGSQCLLMCACAACQSYHLLTLSREQASSTPK
eukprot:4787581-Pyramimonas_sp.AAC.1